MIFHNLSQSNFDNSVQNLNILIGNTCIHYFSIVKLLTSAKICLTLSKKLLLFNGKKLSKCMSRKILVCSILSE